MNDLQEAHTVIDFPQWVRDVPVLSGFEAPLPALAEDVAKDLDATMSRLGELIGVSRSPLLMRIQVSVGDDVRTWLLDADLEGCRVTSKVDRRPPDIEAIVDVETWRLIASGNMSPLEAFGRGRLLVRGMMRAARYLARQLYRTEPGSS